MATSSQPQSINLLRRQRPAPRAAATGHRITAGTAASGQGMAIE
ncbi:hypothetical protein [Desulfitispora alkaliphila]